MNDFLLNAGLLWGAVLMYVLATVVNVYALIFDRPGVERAGRRMAWAGLLIHSVALALWWVVTGHGPYFTRHEVLVSDAWITMALFLGFVVKFPAIRRASIFVFPTSFLLIALGLFFNPDIRSLPPTFRSIWLVLHIAFYKVALATILIAFAMSVFYIMRKRTNYAWLVRLPEMPVLDLHAYRFAGFGFTFWAIGMLAGSIWAYQSWGRFWGWDPVETWSLITWALFGFYLHLRRFFRWNGESAAYFYLICFVISMIAAFYMSHVNTSIHSDYFK